MGIEWGPLEVLADPTRRDLYEYVRRSGHQVGRDEAAAAMGISRGLAAFHLDKLVDAGLLTAAYDAPEPRGRGRAPKVYRAAGLEIGLSVPGRRYDLMGEILAEAIDADPADAREAALAAAYHRGRAEGEAERERGGRLERLLERLGFEPDPHDNPRPDHDNPGADAPENIAVRLRNCPFHRLAARHTELVCGLNEAFISGILHGIGATTLKARLAPAPGFCCVRLAAAP